MTNNKAENIYKELMTKTANKECTCCGKHTERKAHVFRGLFEKYISMCPKCQEKYEESGYVLEWGEYYEEILAIAYTELGREEEEY